MRALFAGPLSMLLRSYTASTGAAVAGTPRESSRGVASFNIELDTITVLAHPFPLTARVQFY